MVSYFKYDLGGVQSSILADSRRIHTPVIESAQEPCEVLLLVVHFKDNISFNRPHVFLGHAVVALLC